MWPFDDGEEEAGAAAERRRARARPEGVRYEGHAAAVSKVRISDDGARVVSVDEAGAMLVWGVDCSVE